MGGSSPSRPGAHTCTPYACPNGVGCGGPQRRYGHPSLSPHATVDPYPGHRRLLRRTSPYHEPDLGAWVVTRHADIAGILRNPHVFSSSGKTGIDDPSRIIILVNDDPPRHTERRALVQRPMTRRLDDSLSTWVEGRVDELLDAVAPDSVEVIVDSFDELGVLMDRFHIESCVIDGLPETHKVVDFAREREPTVTACYYTKSMPACVRHRAEAEILQPHV